MTHTCQGFDQRTFIVGLYSFEEIIALQTFPLHLMLSRKGTNAPGKLFCNHCCKGRVVHRRSVANRGKLAVPRNSKKSSVLAWMTLTIGKKNMSTQIMSSFRFPQRPLQEMCCRLRALMITAGRAKLGAELLRQTREEGAVSQRLRHIV